MTPLSTSPLPASDGPAWRHAIAVAALAAALVLVAVAGRVIWFDAYWLFRETPPWLAVTGGGNRLLDRQTRRAKTLQALDRSYRLALIGSSTVYNGLDPAEIGGPYAGAVFNAGISALMAGELPTVASLVASRPDLEAAVIGLDYYMFSRRGGPPPLSPALAGAPGRWTARLGSLFSRYAIADAWIGRVARGNDPGAWTYSGFRSTPGLSPALTLLNDATRRRTTDRYRPETLRHVGLALDALKGRRVQLYLSPVNAGQRRVMADLGVLEDFGRWRAEVARLAADRGVPFRDLSDLGTRYPFDPAAGSTDAWLDNLHYTPVIGRLVLAELGLRPGGGEPDRR